MYACSHCFSIYVLLCSRFFFDEYHPLRSSLVVLPQARVLSSVSHGFCWLADGSSQKSFLSQEGTAGYQLPTQETDALLQRGSVPLGWGAVLASAEAPGKGRWVRRMARV